MLAGVLPAGVDVVSIGARLPLTAEAASVIRARIQRSFELVVVTSAAALPMPSRTVATRLSVLAMDGVVIGPTPSGGM